MTPEVALTLPWSYIHVYYHSSQISLLVSQVSGERLQDHWSSGIPILLKLYRCCDHALKICMWFGYNPQINFYHFFCNLNLAIFRAF